MTKYNSYTIDDFLNKQIRSMVERTAHKKWLKEGKPVGRELLHWLEAEKEINRLLNEVELQIKKVK